MGTLDIVLYSLLYLMVGLYVGLIIGYLIKEEGVSVKINVISGLICGLISGFTGLILGFGNGIFFAFAGTIAALFIVNVFHQHHIEDLPPVHPYDL